MINWNQFRRRVTTFLFQMPFRSYGELVLRPVIIAEQAAGAEIASSAADNKK